MAKTAVPRTKAKTPIGILKAVIKAIREEPKRYNQMAILETGESAKRYARNGLPSCGTVCCVAGWTTVLADGVTSGPVLSRATRLLGLNNDQAEWLFDGGALMKMGVAGKPGTKKYAEAGVVHIVRFMRAHMDYTGPDL